MGFIYFTDIIVHFAMIAMLLDFKSNIYGFVWAYFEFWYWAGFCAVFIRSWAGFGLVLPHRPGNPGKH